MPIRGLEQEFWGRALSNLIDDGISYDMMENLIVLYNTDPNSVPEKYRSFVDNDLINRARKAMLDLATYTDGKRTYIGPKYPRSERDFEKYGMPSNLEKVETFGNSVAAAEREVNPVSKNVRQFERLVSTFARMGFSEVYKEQMENGNTEYVFAHPEYKAIIHFELKQDGSLAPRYASTSGLVILMPRKVSSFDSKEADKKEVIVSHYVLEENISRVLAAEEHADWPEIRIGKDHFLTSTEDYSSLSQLREQQDLMGFFSIRTIQKIASSPKLFDIMGKNNITQIQQVVSDVGLSYKDALARYKNRAKD